MTSDFDDTDSDDTTDELEVPDLDEPLAGAAIPGPGPVLTARALRSLPERWRAVLWPGRLEEATAGQIAERLRGTDSETADLSHRALDALSTAYLRMYLDEATRWECRAAAGKLGRQARGALSRRDARLVSRHVGGCAQCGAIYADLVQMEDVLRGVIAPRVLGGGPGVSLAARPADPAPEATPAAWATVPAPTWDADLEPSRGRAGRGRHRPAVAGTPRVLSAGTVSRAALPHPPAAAPVLSDELEAAIARGRRHRAAGELDAAAEVFTAAHEQFPAQARPLVERGAILILQHRYDRSRADYAAARRLDPQFPGLDSYVAELDLYTGRAAAALALSERAAVAEPGNLMHQINIAHAHLLLGHTGPALAAYRELAPRYHERKQRLGGDLALQDLRLLVEAGVDVPDLAAAHETLRAAAAGDAPGRAPGAG